MALRRHTALRSDRQIEELVPLEIPLRREEFMNNYFQRYLYEHSNLNTIQTHKPKPSHKPNYIAICINNLDKQQTLLFHGFIRRTKIKYIPTDIINLCFRFYQIDFRYLLFASIDDIGDGVLFLAKECSENNEYFISYQLFKILTKYHEKDFDELAYYHYLTARVAHKWNELQLAEEEYEAAIIFAGTDDLNYYDNVDKYHYHYGLLLRSQKEYTKSIQQLKLAFDCHNKAEYAFECARAYHKLQKHQDAEMYFKKAIKLNKKNANYRYCYGMSLKQRRKYNQAVQQLEKASFLRPKNSKYLFEIAQCFDRMKSFDNAQTFYVEAIRINPQNLKYNHKYALLLKNNGMFQEALIQFKHLKEINPKEYGYKYIVECANTCQKFGKFEKAKKYYLKAIQLKPKEFEAYYLYARLLRDDIRDYIESERYYLKALQINDKHDAINGSFGYLLYLMGSYYEAMVVIKEQLKINDKNIWGQYYHGLLNETFGNHKKAEKSLLKAKELIEWNHDREIVLKHLKVIKSADPLNMGYHNRFEDIILEISQLHS